MANCGCTPGIELTNPGGAKAFITFCPKHAAVDDLIAALEAIYDIAAETPHPDDPGVSVVLSRIEFLAEDAIRKSQIPAESGAQG